MPPTPVLVFHLATWVKSLVNLERTRVRRDRQSIHKKDSQARHQDRDRQATGRSFIFHHFPSQMPRYLYKQRPGTASCTRTEPSIHSFIRSISLASPRLPSSSPSRVTLRFLRVDIIIVRILKGRLPFRFLPLSGHECFPPRGFRTFWLTCLVVCAS